MYAKLSETESAQKAFDEMPDRDTVSWNSMINCYTQNGFLLEALKMFREMYLLGFVPKPELVASCLSTCAKSENWRLGRAIHALILLDEKLEYSSFVATSLLDFYWRYGDPNMAFRVFDQIMEKNVVSWTAMICGCIEHRDYVKACACVRAMQLEYVKPNRVTLISVLPVCAKLQSITNGKEIHGYAIRHGYDSDIRFTSSLLHMYCECGGAFHTAKLIFERSMKNEIVMWSSMILGYSKSKNSAREAFRLFNEMQMQGIIPNSVTLLALISACTSLLSLSDGCVVHGYSWKTGLGNELFVQNALINMYSKCGSLKDALQMLDEMTIRDCVSWSALISAYGLYGYTEEALCVFYEMQRSGIKADEVIYLAVLSTCNHGGLVDEGKRLFDRASKDVNVSLTMEHYACFIDLLGRAGELQDAYDVMCGMPMKPSSRILSSLVSACKLHGRLDIAESLASVLVGIEPENAANHTLLSMIYAESDNWVGVEEVRRYMKERNLRKNSSFSKI
ncbi:pentatricopeptide repeat-containing protein at4g31070 mitochondrial [Phtheirospermum japonicum]|uniref:Pentatricopeptide repeat-containing protein at4g31070 mitochondrial n=1 Tax=Phtheirospermum japonicum TaxID=374723 RepID=A0A830BKN0_9LAMI|nr:pentatricopeptide repeat-containing protein at4g31070 mitochondrial [Phtheirospermum japonicum]